MGSFCGRRSKDDQKVLSDVALMSNCSDSSLHDCNDKKLTQLDIEINNDISILEQISKSNSKSNSKSHSNSEKVITNEPIECISNNPLNFINPILLKRFSFLEESKFFVNVYESKIKFIRRLGTGSSGEIQQIVYKTNIPEIDNLINESTIPNFDIEIQNTNLDIEQRYVHNL